MKVKNQKHICDTCNKHIYTESNPREYFNNRVTVLKNAKKNEFCCIECAFNYYAGESDYDSETYEQAEAEIAAFSEKSSEIGRSDESKETS